MFNTNEFAGVNIFDIAKRKAIVKKINPDRAYTVGALFYVDEIKELKNVLPNAPENIQKRFASYLGQFIWDYLDMNIVSEAVQLAAVKKHGSAIELIKNPSEVVQLAAVAVDWKSFFEIENPTNKVKLLPGCGCTHL